VVETIRTLRAADVRDAAGAAALIDALRTRLAGTHRVNVPSDNRVAQAILQARGYRFARINLGYG
jgi:hypothetical protein